MRTLAASALYLSLAASIFAQQPNGDDSAARIANTNRLVRLVNSYRQSGDYRAAETVLREWLGSEPAGTEVSSTVQITLAHLMLEEGRSTEARKLFTQIAHSPSATWQSQLRALSGLADVDLQQGDSKASIEEWNLALDMARGHQDTESEVLVLRGLGHAWLSAGSTARVEPLLRRSLQMVENDPAAQPLDVAASLIAMGEFYRAEDKLAMAEDVWSRALAIEQKVFGDGHPQVAILLQIMADVYAERHETDLACDYATRAAETMRQWFGEDSSMSATALANLAYVEQSANTLAAAKHYETAIRILRRFPELGSSLKTVMQRYAALLKTMHRDQEAKALNSEVKSFRIN